MKDNSLLEIALAKFKNNAGFDDWINNLFQDKGMLHLLLGRCINAERVGKERKLKLKVLRKHLTANSRANASKRRALKRLMIRFHIEQVARKQGYGNSWIYAQLGLTWKQRCRNAKTN